MIELFVVFILLFAVMQPTDAMIAVASVFAITVAVAWGVTPHLGGYEAYWFAALFDVGIMFIVLKLRHTTISNPLIYLSAGSVFLNLYGMTVYHFEFNPTAYSHMGLCYYAIALIILATGGPDAIRKREIHFRLPRLSGFDPAHGVCHIEMQGETEK